MIRKGRKSEIGIESTLLYKKTHLGDAELKKERMTGLKLDVGA